MWHTFKEEESAENQYGNNVKNTTHLSNKNSSSIRRKNSNRKTNCQTTDVRSIEASSGIVEHGTIRQFVSTANNKLQQKQRFDPELGGLASASRLKAHVPHERHTNMHSSAVVADSTAVIVNIGGCDQSAELNTNIRTNYNSQQQQLRGTNVRVRRTSSGASYSEVALGAHRRERKISSSSQTSKYGNNQKRTVSPQVSPQLNRHKPTRHLRAEQSSTQNVNVSHRREQSPKPSESPRALALRRHKTQTVDAGSSRKFRQHSSETNENASINRTRRRQRDSSFSSSTASSCNGSCSSDDGETNTTSTSSGEPNLPYPGFPEVALKYLTQDTRPRNWCLMMITNPYPFLQTTKY